MPKLTCEISHSLMRALEAHQHGTGETVDHVVMRALADALQVDHGTLFQISTSGALVEGVTGGAVTVAELAEHGDFGLGTFADLDGEMVVVEGVCYRVRGTGEVTVAQPGDLVPFAVVTDFRAERTATLEAVSSLDDLTGQLDALRSSPNQFFAARIAGVLPYLKTRAVCKTDGTAGLADAAARQAEFELHDVTGVLVGFWSPAYVKTVNVAGWHLHFLNAERNAGGHVLDCRGAGLRAEVQHLSDFRMAIPETPAFLAADLSQDPTAALEKAEKER
jgi:acetolactate decarboxylase